MIYFQYSVLVVVVFWLAWSLVSLAYSFRNYKDCGGRGYEGRQYWADTGICLFVVSMLILLLGGALVWIY